MKEKLIWSHGRSLSVVTRLRVGRSGVLFPAGATRGFFLFATASRPVLGHIWPPIQWLTGPLSPGLKGPGRKAYYSPPSSVEVRNAWSFTSNNLYFFCYTYLNFGTGCILPSCVLPTWIAFLIHLALFTTASLLDNSEMWQMYKHLPLYVAPFTQMRPTNAVILPSVFWVPLEISST